MIILKLLLVLVLGATFSHSQSRRQGARRRNLSGRTSNRDRNARQKLRQDFLSELDDLDQNDDERSRDKTRDGKQRDFRDDFSDEDLLDIFGEREEEDDLFSSDSRGRGENQLELFNQLGVQFFGTRNLLGRGFLSPFGESGDIIQVLKSSNQFSIFLKALEITKLYQTLKSAGPLTVLAVPNSVFATYSRDSLKILFENKLELRRVVLRHISRQSISSLLIPHGISQIDMADRKKLTIGSLGDQLAFYSCNGAAQLLELDIFATNGIIHVIDDIL